MMRLKTSKLYQCLTRWDFYFKKSLKGFKTSLAFLSNHSTNNGHNKSTMMWLAKPWMSYSEQLGHSWWQNIHWTLLADDGSIACTWNFHLCPNGEIFQNSLSCPMVHKAWKGMWKEWEFCSCPLINNGNVHLNIGNYVDGTFCMNDGNMLLESFVKEKL